MAQTKRPSGEATRRRILEGAVALLGRDGPTGFSAAALAAEVGVSKSTLFHHFPKLQQIPLEAFDMLNEAVVDVMPPAGAGLEEVLMGIGERYFALMSERRAFLAAQFALVQTAIYDEALTRRVSEMLERTIEGVAASIEGAGVERGAARAYARTLVALLDGLGLHMLSAGTGTEHLVATWSAMCGLIVEAQRAKGAAS